MNQTNLNIIFLTGGPFPTGFASTNRLLSLSLGLAELDCNVKVICYNSTEKKGDKRNAIKGIYGRLNYFYILGNNIKPKNKIIYLIKLGLGCIKSLILLYKNNKISKIDFIFYEYNNRHIFSVIIILFSRIIKIKLIQERNEYPLLNNSSIFDKISNWIYLKIILPRFDCLVVMTNQLYDFFIKRLNMKIPVVIIRSTVICDRFISSYSKENYNENGKEIFRITYCGSLNNKKDGVDILLKSISKVKKQGKRITLMIIAFGSDLEIQEFQILCDKLSLKKDIQLFINIAANDIPVFFKYSHMFILPRPQSIQAEYGFPTKLGEYLATGKPVICTRVGEISAVLNADCLFLIEPNDANMLSAKIIHIIENYSAAQKIGERGREIAYTKLNYTVQAKKLYDFLGRIKEND